MNHHLFRYAIGGELTPAPGLIPDTDEDWGKLLEKAGASLLTNYGEHGAVSLSVWLFSDQRWVLMFYDFDSGCLIEVIGWPAFLDALRHYSPVVALAQRELTIDELKKSIQA